MEQAKNVGDGLIDACAAQQEGIDAQEPVGLQVEIGELLLAMKFAYEKMGVRNSHKGLIITAGSVIIALTEENAALKEQQGLLKSALEAAQQALKPLVTLA